MNRNPFLISGYMGAEYFCDRVKETERLTQLVSGNNANVVLMAQRRIGKTMLIQHVLQQPEVAKNFYTFVIDIYATCNIEEMVQVMGQSIVKTLAKRSQGALQKFLSVVSSLRVSMTFDAIGNPSWGLESTGHITDPHYTLDQIFDYLEGADKPCIVAIDEFQQITNYPEKNTEAILRTRIQHCKNSTYIFSGSERSILGEIFESPARPFFASTHTMTLGVIPEEKYSEFINHHFTNDNKSITPSAIHRVYTIFEGVTWYMQKIMGVLYLQTPSGRECNEDDVVQTINQIIEESSVVYQDTMYQLTSRQKQLLVAIGKEGKAREITGNRFISKYHLASASSIHTTIKTLIEKQLVTNNLGTYEVYDKFLGLWLNKYM